MKFTTLNQENAQIRAQPNLALMIQVLPSKLACSNMFADCNWFINVWSLFLFGGLKKNGY
jgi:hypothetical protein